MEESGIASVACLLRRISIKRFRIDCMRDKLYMILKPFAKFSDLQYSAHRCLSQFGSWLHSNDASTLITQVCCKSSSAMMQVHSQDPLPGMIKFNLHRADPTR